MHFASGYKLRPALVSVSPRHAQRFFQQIDLLDDGSLRDVRFFGGAAEAASIGDAQKGFKLRIVRGGSRSLPLFLFI